MFRSYAAAVVILVLSCAPAAAQWGETVHHIGVPEAQAEAASPQCGGGVVYDDGVFNDAYSMGDGDPGDSTMVMKFDLPAGTNTLDQVCVCFTRLASGPTSMSFDIVVYNDNGPGGQPGTLIAEVPATASSIPQFATTQFYSIDVSGEGIVLPDTGVYVGAIWPGGSILMCGDRSPATPQRSNYGSLNQGTTWTSMPPLFAGPPGGPPRALGVRVDPGISLAPPPVPSGSPIQSSQYPDFRFWVRISDTRIGTPVAGCLPETVCVAGAIPTRAEVFLRIVGPKSNGFLWPNIVKFNTTKTEVWIRQVSTGITKYYLLPALPTDSSTLPGLVDKTGFLP
jgi:hypothetical protein